ncbi:MAG TPA: LURP-one-related family protein, partial [Nitrososphaera sp.]|nr:LURP-one-related family protein [Nitrososphaera sp.]
MSAPNSLLNASELVLKKRILSLREHYDLEERNGGKLGEADGNFFQLPAKFVVRDASGSELMYVEGKILSLRKQFSFYDSSGAPLGTINKKLVKLIGEEYWVERDGAEYMRIYGNFTAHDYQFKIGGADVASV